MPDAYAKLIPNLTDLTLEDSELCEYLSILLSLYPSFIDRYIDVYIFCAYSIFINDI